MNESLYIELIELISTMEQKVIFIEGYKFIDQQKSGLTEIQNWLVEDWRIKQIVPQSIANALAWKGKQEDKSWGSSNDLEEREEYGGFLIYLVR